MRTDVALYRDGRGEWDASLGYISVTHDAPLTAEQAAAFRELGRWARERVPRMVGARKEARWQPPSLS
jgi:hypothetical protein